MCLFLNTNYRVTQRKIREIQRKTNAYSTPRSLGSRVFQEKREGVRAVSPIEGLKTKKQKSVCQP